MNRWKKVETLLLSIANSKNPTERKMKIQFHCRYYFDVVVVVVGAFLIFRMINFVSGKFIFLDNHAISCMRRIMYNATRIWVVKVFIFVLLIIVNAKQSIPQSLLFVCLFFLSTSILFRLFISTLSIASLFDDDDDDDDDRVEVSSQVKSSQET